MRISEAYKPVVANIMGIIWFIFAPILIIVYLASLWASVPVVQFSWSTQSCIEVVFGEGDCNNLPKKYTREWVK